MFTGIPLSALPAFAYVCVVRDRDRLRRVFSRDRENVRRDRGHRVLYKARARADSRSADSPRDYRSDDGRRHLADRGRFRGDARRCRAKETGLKGFVRLFFRSDAILIDMEKVEETKPTARPARDRLVPIIVALAVSRRRRCGRLRRTVSREPEQARKVVRRDHENLPDSRVSPREILEVSRAGGRFPRPILLIFPFLTYTSCAAPPTSSLTFPTSRLTRAARTT